MKGLNIFFILDYVSIVYSCRELDIYDKHGKYDVTCLLSNYVNVSNIESAIKCGARCIQDARCHSVSFESATGLCCINNAVCVDAQYNPGFEMLVIGQDVKEGESCLSWQQMNAGDVDRTVRYMGNNELEEIVHVAFTDGQVLPGLRPISQNTAYVNYNGDVVQSDIYDTLVVHPICAITWLAFDGNLIPENAVKGGDRRGTTMYVARKIQSAGYSGYVAGQLNEAQMTLYYATSGMKGSTTTDIEILIVYWRISWRLQLGI